MNNRIEPLEIATKNDSTIDLIQGDGIDDEGTSVVRITTG